MPPNRQQHPRKLTANQRTLLQLVYDAFRRTSSWPKVRELRVTLRRQLEFEDVCRELGTDLIVADDVTMPNAKCWLSLRALLYCSESDDDRKNVVKLVRQLADMYVHGNLEKTSAEVLASTLGFDRATMRCVHRLTQYEASLTRGITEDADGNPLEITLSPELIHFEDVESLDDYFEIRDRRRQLFESRTAPWGSGSILEINDIEGGPERAEPSSTDERGRSLRLDLQRIRNVLIAVATGGDADTLDYSELRSRLVAAPELTEVLPDFVVSCKRPGEFVALMKATVLGYQERRRFITDAFEPAFARLDAFATPHDEIVSRGLHDVPAVSASWRKSLERLESDPKGAITAARTTLEAVLKHCLDGLGVAYDPTADVSKLARLATKKLELGPTPKSHQAMREILAGCRTVIAGIAALRNELGDAHATVVAASSPDRKHAELAVNIAGSVALYLARCVADADA